MTTVGFMHDDMKKHKRKIQGYKILGGQDKLADFIPKYRINEVIVASAGIRSENFRATCNVCAQMGVTLRNMELSMKRMGDVQFGAGSITEQKPSGQQASPLVDSGK